MNCNRCVLFCEKSFRYRGDCSFWLSIVFWAWVHGKPRWDKFDEMDFLTYRAIYFVYVRMCVVPAGGFTEPSRLVMCMSVVILCEKVHIKG